MVNLNITREIYSIKQLPIDEAFKALSNSNNLKIFTSIFSQSLFAENIVNLKKKPVFPNTDNIEGELALILFILSRNSYEINNFIDAEEDFQKKLLNNQYKESLDILDAVDSNFGVSLWSIENRFNILQEIGGVEKNWEYLSYLSRSSNDQLVDLLINVYSKKAEDETTYDNYQNDIHFLSYRLPEEFKEYLNFVLENKKVAYEKFAYIINHHSNSSLIDLYLFTISVLNHLSASNDYSRIFYQAVKILSRTITDPRLLRLREISDIFTEKIEIKENLVLEILNKYSVGSYKEVVTQCEKLIKRDPTIFLLYEIYLKSLIQLNQIVDKSFNQTVQGVLDNLTVLFVKDEKYFQAREFLLKLGVKYSKVNFFKQLYSFVYGYTGKTASKTFYNEYFIFSKVANPQAIHLNYFNKKKTYKGDFRNHMSLLINYSIFIKDVKTLNLLNIPANKKRLYECRINYHHGITTESALSQVNQLIGAGLDTYSYEEALLYRVDILKRRRDFADLADLIVDSYFKNNFFIERIDIESIVADIVDSNYYLSHVNINLPILFYLNNVDDYYQFVSADLFLQSQGIDRPSELDVFLYDRDKIILFLEKILTIETLNNFYLLFSNDDEVVAERIAILHILRELNLIKLPIYEDEINLIRKKASIKKLLKNLNNGRIYYNFLKTVDSQKNNYLVIFNRLKHLIKYSHDNDLEVLDTDQLVKKYIDEFTNNRSYRNRADFLSFKNLYFDMSENYLFSSEYGLNGVLSTRFRHGEIENKLRKVFSTTCLISTKNTKSEYSNIDYWERYRYVDVNNELETLQGFFKEFSYKIDDLINHIVHKKVQINSNRIYNNDEALFNFKNSENYIWILFKDFENNDFTFGDFIEYLNDAIRVLTEKLLKNTVQYFTIELKKEFLNFINEFQIKISTNIRNEHILVDVNQKLNPIKTAIEKELLEIGKWFKINNTIDSTTLDFRTLVEIAMDSFDLDVKYKVSDSSNVLFQDVSYYIDILRILIDNSIKYSNLQSNQLTLDFVISRDERQYVTAEGIKHFRQHIVFEIQNNFDVRADADSLEQNLKEAALNWDNNIDQANNEGGSGFKKIGKMLKYDVKAYKVEIKYKIINQNLTVFLEYEI